MLEKKKEVIEYAKKLNTDNLSPLRSGNISVRGNKDGINGFFIGVPTVIGSGGVEKILEFALHDDEKAALNETLDAVKKTVAETGL